MSPFSWLPLLFHAGIRPGWFLTAGVRQGHHWSEWNWKYLSLFSLLILFNLTASFNTNWLPFVSWNSWELFNHLFILFVPQRVWDILHLQNLSYTYLLQALKYLCLFSHSSFSVQNIISAVKILLWSILSTLSLNTHNTLYLLDPVQFWFDCSVMYLVLIPSIIWNLWGLEPWCTLPAPGYFL